MLPTLLADTAPPPADGGDSPNVAYLAVGVFLVIVLWWLYTVGFYGKAFRALLKTAVALGVVSAGVFLIAAGMDQTAALSNAIGQNPGAVGIAFGVFALAGLVTFYGSAGGGGNGNPVTTPVIRATGATSGGSPNPGCPTCRGSGTTEDNCGSCSGMGETRCSYSNHGKGWWGAEYATEWCEAGVIRVRYGGSNGACASCNGRGFTRCYACRGRGVVKGVCATCKGTGTA